MRGRKPTPTRLKILRGNPGRRKLREDELTPAQGIPPTPAIASSYHAQILSDVSVLTQHALSESC